MKDCETLADALLESQQIISEQEFMLTASQAEVERLTIRVKEEYEDRKRELQEGDKLRAEVERLRGELDEGTLKQQALADEVKKLRGTLDAIRTLWIEGIGDLDNPWRRTMARLVGDIEGIKEWESEATDEQ